MACVRVSCATLAVRALRALAKFAGKLVSLPAAIGSQWLAVAHSGSRPSHCGRRLQRAQRRARLAAAVVSELVRHADAEPARLVEEVTALKF